MSEAMTLIARDTGGERHTALLLGDKLSEYYVEADEAQSLVGAIFLGTVERVLPAVSAAFVKLGLERNGFLPITEQPSFRAAQGKAPLMSGNEVIVQVKKDAKGDKGVFLTRDISMVGQYVILMPLSGFVGVSKRVTDDSEREAARRLGKRLSGGRFGVIVRHAALYANEDDIRGELSELCERWESVRTSAEHRLPPSLLHRDADMLTTIIRDYSARYDIEICSQKSKADDIPDGVKRSELTDIELNALWRGKRIDAQLSEALLRKVCLPGGGSLVVDEREALQTIDINSGENVEPADGMSLALYQNLAAVPHIARQLRLRALSGIILIDFIDMETDEEREQVLAYMREAVADDRVKTVVHGFTSLGLMELTRKRTRESLLSALTEPCNRCHESGRIRRSGILTDEGGGDV